MRAEHDVVAILNSLPVIDLIRKVAAQESVSVSLAGGALRDLFLDGDPPGFDFIVEGDAESLARHVSTMVPGGVLDVDSASGAARYRAPEMGNLRFAPANGLSSEQYLRRHSDFTVNSLLFDLREGTVVDRHGALVDLERQTIRCVPPAGFADKPAHLLVRAIRLALLTPAFALETDTRASLMAHASLVASADLADVGFELHAMLKSTAYTKGIRLLGDCGVLHPIFSRVLSCAARWPGTHNRADAGADVDEAIRLCTVLDDVSASCEELASRHLSLLRLLILLSTLLRGAGLDIAAEDGRRFLLTQGDRLETTLNQMSSGFSSVGIHAFRVRMVMAGFWRGLASITAGAASLEETLSSAVNAFGAQKGTLSALLIGAAWLLRQGAGPNAGRDAQRLSTALQRLTVRDAPVPTTA